MLVTNGVYDNFQDIPVPLGALKCSRKCLRPSPHSTAHSCNYIKQQASSHNNEFMRCYSLHITSLNLCFIDEQPTMMELMRFQGREKRINIPQEVSTKYPQFGIFLLEDTNGTRVRNMEYKHRGDPEQINTEILQEWVSGRGRLPISWATLTEVLRDVELCELASDIEAVKLQTTDDSDT